MLGACRDYGWPFEVAHHLGAVPWLWLVVLHLCRQGRGWEWWWLAAAFGVSWIADTVAHCYGQFPISPLYLVTQTGLIAAVLLPRRDTLWFLGLLVPVAGIAFLTYPLGKPDWLVHTVAWLGLTGSVYPLKALGRLRWALLVSFGLGWVAWMGYVLSPGWISWIGYQSVRAVGIGLFCWAAWHPEPQLRLA